MRKILIGAFVFALFLIWDFNRFLSSPITVDKNLVVVEQGAGFNDLRISLLSNNNSWFSAFYYPLYIKFNQPLLKYGPHPIPSNSTLGKVIALLGEDPADVRVRLPEGERMEVYASLLAAAGLGKESEILACFKSCAELGPSFFSLQSGYEGFLFPDTYVFGVESTPKDIVALLLKNFRTKLDPLINKHQAFFKEHSVREVVIIASLLEREAVTLADKKMVAGILYNRIREDMRLDVDATVSYIKGDWRAAITYNDLQLESPYNTRKVKGLPLGPIANPGLVSLEAAITPTASPYLYYLTGNNGQMYYAKTLEEHNLHKEKFL